MPSRFRNRLKSSRSVAAVRVRFPCGRFWASGCTRAVGHKRPVNISHLKQTYPTIVKYAEYLQSYRLVSLMANVIKSRSFFAVVQYSIARYERNKGQ